MKRRLIPILLIALALVLPAVAGAKGKKKKGDDFDISSGPGSAEDLMGLGSGNEPPEVTRRRDDAIAQLTDLIRTMPNSNSKAVRMIQLAELYWEKSQVLHLKAIERYNMAYDKWFQATDGGKKRGPREPKLKAFDTESPKFTQKAIEIYEYVLKKYPQNSKGDQAMFYLGLNYLDQKKQTKAEGVFKKLVANFPQSPFIPDAYLALGEFHFENKNISEATGFYQKASKYQKAKNYAYARYKLGWCYLNSGNPNDAKRAVNEFKEVIRWSDTNPDAGLNLKDQALKDLVAAYAEIGNVNLDEAERYFQSVGGGKYFRAMLTLLAGTYFEQGRDDESIALYRRLVGMHPQDVDVLKWETEIMKAFIRKGNRGLVLKQMQRIVALLDSGSAWVKANVNEKDTIDSYRESTELAISKYTFEVYEESRRLHKRYSGKESWDGFQRAEQYCGYYLTTFPKSRNTYEMKMMLAETKWKLAQHKLAPSTKYRVQKYDEAGRMYADVMKSNPKGKHFANAGDGLLLAYDKMVEAAKPPKPGKDDFKAMKLPAVQKKLIDAMDLYVSMNPKGKRVLPSTYKAAYTYYEYNQFEKAQTRFWNIIQQHPDSQQARFAADLILNIQETKKDTAAANKWARQLLGVPTLVADAKFKRELEEIVERSAFKMIEPLEKQKKYDDAAKAYVAFVNEFPRSDLRDKALYNASVAYVNADKINEAIKVRETFIHKFPNSEYTPNVVLFLGDNYRKITYFEKATEYYELLADKYANSFKDKNGKVDPNPANDALYNAALFRENLGQWQKAIENYRAYLKRKGKGGDSHEVLYTIGEIYERNGQVTNAGKTYQEYINTYGSQHPDRYLDALLKLADIEYKKGNKTTAYKKYKGITNEYAKLVKQKKKIGPTGLNAAAKSAFTILEPEFEDYQKIRLQLPEKKMKKQLAEKLKAVQTLAPKYEKVVAYKHGEWAVASLYQMGRIQEEFADALLHAPVPANLTADQAEIYKFELLQVAEPVQQGALNAYKKALATSHQYAIYTEYTLLSINRLQKMDPENYQADAEVRIAAGSSNEALYSSPLLDLK